MFIFAHAFLGALIGLVFISLSKDRLMLPLCILGAILPDLLDKPLALLFPLLFGPGRTVGHTLLFALVFILAGITLWYYRHTLAGLAIACGILSHHILDELWSLPGLWFFPLYGPFPGEVIPDYVGHFLRLEITSISEWVFGCMALLILLAWYLSGKERPSVRFIRPGTLARLYLPAACLLGVMGVILLVAGIMQWSWVFVAPTYLPSADLLAGIVALGGMIGFIRLSCQKNVL